MRLTEQQIADLEAWIGLNRGTVTATEVRALVDEVRERRAAESTTEPSWERVEKSGDDATYRLSVPNGWLYHVKTDGQWMAPVFVPMLTTR